MVKKFVARTNSGQEFIFDRSLMIGAPANSADKIAEQLTERGFRLKPGQIWKAYDNDFFYNDYITGEIKSYSPNRSTRIYRYNG